MTEQPEALTCPRCGKVSHHPDDIHTCTPRDALRLADELDDGDYDHTRQAAAELRRLHEELERKSDAIQRLWKERDGLRADYKRLLDKHNALAINARRYRDLNAQLLKALNAMLTHMGMDEDDWNKPTFDQARAAIAAAR